MINKNIDIILELKWKIKSLLQLIKFKQNEINFLQNLITYILNAINNEVTNLILEAFSAIQKIGVDLKTELFNKVMNEKPMSKHSKIYEILKVYLLLIITHFNL